MPAPPSRKDLSPTPDPGDARRATDDVETRKRRATRGALTFTPSDDDEAATVEIDRDEVTPGHAPPWLRDRAAPPAAPRRALASSPSAPPAGPPPRASSPGPPPPRASSPGPPPPPRASSPGPPPPPR
ncbi:MAG: hypothetical protein IT372_27515, partial [Polyangiaceae bacterium]|nr:hypothetical protein [Polyangiaceae bacterium]